MNTLQTTLTQGRETENIRKFTNELALQLMSSDDTMHAIRLFRKELPQFLAQHQQSILAGILKEAEQISNEQNLFIGEKPAITLDLLAALSMRDKKE